jgi:hypothetical protein
LKIRFQAKPLENQNFSLNFCNPSGKIIVCVNAKLKLDVSLYETLDVDDKAFDSHERKLFTHSLPKYDLRVSCEEQASLAQ